MNRRLTKVHWTVWRRISVACLLLGFVWFIAWLGARLLIVSAPLNHADAIIVLSGSRAFTERASLAADLYKAGHSSRIILTNDDQRGGWSNTEQRNLYFHESAARELRRFGVPEPAITVIPQPVSSTRDEALLIRDYCERSQLQSILICDSALPLAAGPQDLSQSVRRQWQNGRLMATVPGWQSPKPALWWRLSTRVADGGRRVFEAGVLCLALVGDGKRF